jgi:hypothetical protein
MSEVTAIATILERLGFTRESAGYMTRACNVDSLDEVKLMDGEDDVENMIKRVNLPGGTKTVVTGNDTVKTPNVELQVSLCAENNLNVKLLPLPHPPVRARTDARTNPSAQRAIQLMSVLAHVYAV